MSGKQPIKKKPRLLEEYGLRNFDPVPAEACHQAKPELLQCPLCKKQRYKGVGLYDDRYLLLECCSSPCEGQWFLCLECKTKQRVPIVKKSQMRDHNNNNHSERKMRGSTTTDQHMFDDTSESFPMPDDNDDASDANPMIAEQTEAPSSWSEVGDSECLGFENKESQLYFQQCHLAGSKRAGIEYLVKKITKKANLVPQDYVNQKLPFQHAEVQTRIAHLAFLLPKSQTELMVKALDGAYRIGCEDGFACYRSMHKRGENADSIEFTQELVKSRAHGWSTCIPQSWNDVRQNYLEGSRSMLVNLPLPTIHKDVDGHSYVLISDCIRHFLGHQSVSDICLIPPQLGDEAVTHSSLSKRAQEILDLPHGALSALRSYILLWSDDVEPNRTKANRGSIWLMTATIATCPDNGHSMAHTYPIAVGKKGDDHDPVLNRLEQSLEQLRSGGDYYIGDQNKKARITFEVFATLQDQPERRDFNCMRAGNGTHTARFGVSADHGFLYREAILPSCKKCLDYMQKALAENSTPWPMPRCNVCVRWDALNDPNGLCKYRPPSDYPLSSNRVIETTRGPMIRPFKITYDTLKAGVDAAHEGFVSGGWSNQNCESYLEVEGLASKFIDNVLEHSTRNYSLALARAEPDRYQAIIDAAERNPMKYNKIPYPAAWSRPTMSLDLHPDVIMHLLFLGVVKTTIIQIQNCLSAQSKLGSFLKSTNSYLREFLSMSIEWLPIQPYQGGKLGGWVSENFLGFSRILPWFFQNIDEAVESTSDYVPPENLPQNKWLMRHLKYWLQVRGLDTKGKRDELQERVARYMADGAPDPLPAPDIPPASVEAVLLSLGEVLRCVMCPRVSPPLVNRTRYAIRVFLSHYDSLTRPLQQKTPAVLSSYNFLCLLNIPDAMERFGPLRCIWEGGPRGEGFARFAKPYMTQGLRQNWHYNLLLRLHRAKAFDIIMAKETKSMADISDKDALRHRKGCFQKYASAFSLRQQFSPLKPVGERKPLSVLLLKYEDHSTGLCSVVGDYDRILILGIPPKLTLGISVSSTTGSRCLHEKTPLNGSPSLVLLSHWASVCFSHC